MIYKKPSNVNFIDMCIFIDKTAYTEEHDAQKVYEYIYHIIRCLAKEKKFFKINQYYDDFGIFGATRVYMRLVNKKQFEKDSEGNTILKPIRSILNYINATIYPMKVDFEQTAYYQPLQYESDSIDVEYNFDNVLSTEYNYIKNIEFSLALESVSNMCNHFLDTVIYPVDKITWKNICISVKLTLLNQLTLSKKDEEYLNHLFATNRIKDSHVIESFIQNSDSVLLFHIDNKYKDMIIVLVNQLKSFIGKELKELLSMNYVDSNLEDFIINDYKLKIEGFDYEY